MKSRLIVQKVNRLRTPDDAATCPRCGDQPDAMSDDWGFTLFHLCGDKMTLACNYATMQAAVNEWNRLQETTR